MKQVRYILLALIGLILGLGLGLLVSWVLAPVQYVDTTPSTLRVDFKDEYRLLIASAYASNLDLIRARARIGTLEDQDPSAALGEQAQRIMTGDNSTDEIQLLANLSEALQLSPTVEISPTPVITDTETSTATVELSSTPEPTQTPTTTPEPPTVLSPTLSATPTATASITASPEPTSTNTPTPKPIATLAPRPTQTLTATPAVVFELVKKTPFCDPNQPGLLQINLTNALGKPAAGIELDITWLGGDDSFFTGLKPELGYGYADFSMADNTEYALSLSNGATRITGLTTSKCNDTQGGSYSGGIHLEFKQP